jgi:hypothetical protein
VGYRLLYVVSEVIDRYKPDIEAIGGLSWMLAKELDCSAP